MIPMERLAVMNTNKHKFHKKKLNAKIENNEDTFPMERLAVMKIIKKQKRFRRRYSPRIQKNNADTIPMERLAVMNTNTNTFHRNKLAAKTDNNEDTFPME